MPTQQNDPRTSSSRIESGVGGKGAELELGVPSPSRAPANKPRCGPRQGKPTGRLVPTHAGSAPLATLTKTTLGNKYLGSRIDEERSKMRYLV
ncbi:hypothetical protein SLA2020_098090 [Shorea laevis]